MSAALSIETALSGLLADLRAVSFAYSDDEARDDQGCWTDGGSGKAGHLPTTMVDGKRMAADGSELPGHIQALRVPPAWHDVTYSPDPNAPLQVLGKDGKSRTQAIYSAEFTQQQADAKFQRVSELDGRFDEISARNAAAQASDNPRTRATADATALVMSTGIRPGSDGDTGGAVKAYGASTLEGQHVIAGDDGSVSLRYTGKHGVALNIPVNDPAVGAMLLDRKAAAGDGGRLFQTSDAAMLAHVNDLSDGDFKTKDFRTLVGSRTAQSAVESMPIPTNAKDYKASVMSVAKVVSNKLGNTPAVALTSYINPSVFVPWRVAA